MLFEWMEACSSGHMVPNDFLFAHVTNFFIGVSLFTVELTKAELLSLELITGEM